MQELKSRVQLEYICYRHGCELLGEFVRSSGRGIQNRPQRKKLEASSVVDDDDLIIVSRQHINGLV